MEDVLEEKKGEPVKTKGILDDGEEEDDDEVGLRLMWKE